MSFRVTVDVGGTFTDVVVATPDGGIYFAKAPTNRERCYVAISEAISVIADRLRMTVSDLIAGTQIFLFSTTRATNAILEGATARTALLVTAGHRDVLMVREGGKPRPFDFGEPPIEPYVPRSLTFEISERIAADGSAIIPIARERTRELLRTLPERGVQAVGVCLLWSPVNAAHELEVGALIEEELPGMPFSLSHQVWPMLREYRRASITAIDASLKPVMTEHLLQLSEDLSSAGFNGELVAATSIGGAVHIKDMSAKPVLSVKSGPALAPVAAGLYAETELGASNVIVCDTGGTSFDVSLIRDGKVVLTSETWLGRRREGHLISSSTVDARSIGAGGGSIVWIDAGGLLRVGPQSAGSKPGPACYGRGGTAPTVTDAAAVLGYLDEVRFLGGRMRIDVDSARRALAPLADKLGSSIEEAASATLKIAAEGMVDAIYDITVHEGLDPRESLVVAGGGASGLLIGHIVKEIGCKKVLIPRAAGVLSAVGGQASDLIWEFNAASHLTNTASFDVQLAAQALASLREMAQPYAEELASHGVDSCRYEFMVDAKYPSQLWVLEMPVDEQELLAGNAQPLEQQFHAQHQRLFAVAEPGQSVDIMAWRLRVFADAGSTSWKRKHCQTREIASAPLTPSPQTYWNATFSESGRVHTPVFFAESLRPGHFFKGPAIVSDDWSTLVVNPACTVEITLQGHFLMSVSC